MPLECPRCLMSNPDAVQFCECGYDFTPHFQGLPFKSAAAQKPKRKRLFSDEMSRGSFLLGIILIWLALSVGELYRIRLELPRHPKADLGVSSLLVGLTDLAAALVVGALGWAFGWIVLAAQSKRDGSLCPKRTTFLVTLVAAAVLFATRTIEPSVLVQHVMQTLFVLAIAIVSYYAGCRGWLGKW
ncbi:hypothetical protein FBQ96_02825 [Nitrospirales bacterium NOB]|nr:hypothetical protein [Nitrospirota bacterium]MCK6493098.1 hypothetical protein [Nitrospira sp.]MDL1888512.1 hypothetical protein [Nitrospirales bacterium NOB]MEB2338542.1 hypothetical protein [Nitrospirales bacterium]